MPFSVFFLGKFYFVVQLFPKGSMILFPLRIADLLKLAIDISIN